MERRDFLKLTLGFTAAAGAIAATAMAAQAAPMLPPVDGKTPAPQMAAQTQAEVDHKAADAVADQDLSSRRHWRRHHWRRRHWRRHWRRRHW